MPISTTATNQFKYSTSNGQSFRCLSFKRLISEKKRFFLKKETKTFPLSMLCLTEHGDCFSEQRMTRCAGRLAPTFDRQ